MNFFSFKIVFEYRYARSVKICNVFFLIFFVLIGSVSAGELEKPLAKGLEGITIRSMWFSSGTVTLKNGEYRGPAKPGSSSEIVVKLTDKRALGEVNGKEAAVVVLATDPGGSGTFYDIVLLFMRSAEWSYADAARLGDRVRVHSVTINNNEIIIDMTEHGSGDALCCPTKDVTRRFTVQADYLAAVREARHGSQDTAIIGPVWQWVRTNYNNDTALVRPAGAPGFSFQLNPDGTIKVRGDCNSAGGSFVVDNSRLSVTIAHSTMAACPEGSLEGQFIRDLNRTGGFILKDDNLFIDLKQDTGTMVFRIEQDKRK